jgi:hypothetical protein
VYKLEPDDIQQMLADAERVLTQPRDKEVMHRLVSATRASTEHEWDKCLIATMLAKAGKMHEAEMVVHDMEVAWQRSVALFSMAKGLLENGDEEHQAMNLLNIAVIEARAGQQTTSIQDKLDADSVLSDIAGLYAEQGELDKANNVAESIENPTRKLRCLEKIAALTPVAEGTAEEAQTPY